ncbi:B-4DMT family transporter [Nocardia sp. BSTN01]|uniref:B-4DMT family transporter n=1 Tax=Nocardia sp. BSTN01 TaxID=2783665 RepID=UPI001890608F|nr:B-4DMT family transporter [Nocardia sp. BSTN01]MBF4997294.1 B-4DMT family transporter [Nocardia sp. BSTN01]
MSVVDSATMPSNRAARRRRITLPLLVRGLGMGAVHTGARMLLAYAVEYWTPMTGLLKWLALGAVMVIALIWGVFDGRRNLSECERPDPDLVVFWLRAAVLAGLSSGVLTWIAGRVTEISSDGNALLFEVTAGAAWILLVTYVPALIGVAVARRLGAHGDR